MESLARGNGEEAGFTLLELLVSLGLLAMMATFTLSTLQRFSDLRRLEIIVGNNERLQTAERHLRQTLSGLRFAHLSFDRSGNSFLQGKDDQMRIANVLDDKLVPGRLNILQYEVVRNSLVLNLGEPKPAEGATSDSIPLLRGVSKVRLSFINAATNRKDAAWQDVWDQNDAPAGIAILIESQDRAKDLLPLFVAIETSGASN